MTLLRSNLLKKANRLIPFEKIVFQKWTGNTFQDGIAVPTFAEGVEFSASVQPVRTEIYEKLGLDFQKDYVTVHASVQMNGTDKQATPDRMVYDGYIWNVQKSNNWFKYDGWSSAVFVRIKIAETPTPPTPPTPDTDENENGNESGNENSQTENSSDNESEGGDGV